jgi:prepilin signal peptidase PulO-like enzyme (type II secretory pathway)
LTGDFLFPDRLFSIAENFIVYWSQKCVQTLPRLAVDLPPEAWWVPALVLLVLGVVAVFDACKGRVPDVPVFFGLLLATAAQGFYASWPLAGEHLLVGFGAAIALWALNQFYYGAFKHDAIGMGDAKWTALAVAAFGLKPSLWAWVIGAWLGLSWLAMRALLALLRRLFVNTGNPRDFYERIHFAPFLFMGLLAGLYWNYLR